MADSGETQGNGAHDGQETVSPQSVLTWEEWLVGIVLCGLVTLVAVQILSRYLLHRSLSYTEEIVRYGFVGITFLGAAVAAYRGKHLSLESASWLPPVVARAGRILSFAGAVVFTLILVIFGIRVVALQMSTGQTTAALGLPMWIIGLAAPVCAAVLLVRIVMAVLRGKGRR